MAVLWQHFINGSDMFYFNMITEDCTASNTVTNVQQLSMSSSPIEQRHNDSNNEQRSISNVRALAKSISIDFSPFQNTRDSCKPTSEPSTSVKKGIYFFLPNRRIIFQVNFLPYLTIYLLNVPFLDTKTSSEVSHKSDCTVTNVQKLSKSSSPIEQRHNDSNNQHRVISNTKSITIGSSPVEKMRDLCKPTSKPSALVNKGIHFFLANSSQSF